MKTKYKWQKKKQSNQLLKKEHDRHKEPHQVVAPLAEDET